ncbi:MAG: histidine--tRNA ligase [Chlamydiia bacterium]|nr:histidine--tRNA ligase [Chlamydiia bacterium]
MSTSVRGTYDVLPDYLAKSSWKSSTYWFGILREIHDHAKGCDLSFVKTPILERKDIFIRSSGVTSDIVSKEMYELEDRSGRSLVLKPEGTASIARALQDVNCYIYEARLYYIDSMFRYSRPQQGRFREHSQFGVELLGKNSIDNDFEVIKIAYDFISKFYPNPQLKVNYIGEALESYSASLKEFFAKHKENLSEDSLNRLEKNPLRILDSKSPKDIELVNEAPSISEYWTEEDKSRFEGTCSIMDACGLQYCIDDKIVRGLDYYTGLVFEIVDENGQTLTGGGRYNKLVEIAKSHVPAVGFGLGIERLLSLIESRNDNKIFTKEPRVKIFNISKDFKSYQSVFGLLDRIRESGTPASCSNIEGKKIATFISIYKKMDYTHIIVIGDKEIKDSSFTIKNIINKQEATGNFIDSFALSLLV